MNNNKSWNILNWNIRGLNAPDKWLALRQKIEERVAGIVCLQEIKRELFDLAYINKFCPQRFNRFEYLPSVGASGGILTAWNGALFTGEMMFQNKFSISIQFTCKTSAQTWILTNIYGPCNHEEKADFLQWFSNIQMPNDVEWIIMGDFNFIRSPEDRNRPGGDVNQMLLFNEAISNLGLIELPLKGRQYS